MSQKMPICKSDPRHLGQFMLKRRVRWAGRVAFGVLVGLQSRLAHKRVPMTGRTKTGVTGLQTSAAVEPPASLDAISECIHVSDVRTQICARARVRRRASGGRVDVPRAILNKCPSSTGHVLPIRYWWRGEHTGALARLEGLEGLEGHTLPGRGRRGRTRQ